MSMKSVNSNFVRVSKLGRGSFGEVWKIQENATGNLFALKVIEIDKDPKKSSKRTEREVDILDLIRNNNSKHPGHRHLVRIEKAWTIPAGSSNPTGFKECWPWFAEYIDRDADFDEDDWNNLERVIFIQMELCTEGTLKDWLKGQDYDLEKGKTFFRHIVAGLMFLQERNLSIVHRDLKPENILLTRDHDSDEIVAKIGDFGLSRQRMENSETSMTNFVGTPIYQSPEVSEGVRHYTSKVDIYSLGLIFFFILEPDRYRRDDASMVKLAEKFRRTCGIPQALADSFTQKFPRETQLIKAMLSRDPESRPSPVQIYNHISSLWSFRTPFNLHETVDSTFEISMNCDFADAPSVPNMAALGQDQPMKLLVDLRPTTEKTVSIAVHLGPTRTKMGVLGPTNEFVILADVENIFDFDRQGHVYCDSKVKLDYRVNFQYWTDNHSLSLLNRVQVERNGHSYACFRIENVISIVIATLRAEAEKILKKRVTGGVIVKPQFLNTVQNQAILDGAKLANFIVSNLMDDTVAMAVQYCRDRYKNKDFKEPFPIITVNITENKLIDAASFTVQDDCSKKLIKLEGMSGNSFVNDPYSIIDLLTMGLSRLLRDKLLQVVKKVFLVDGFNLCNTTVLVAVTKDLQTSVRAFFTEYSQENGSVVEFLDSNFPLMGASFLVRAPQFFSDNVDYSNEPQIRQGNKNKCKGRNLSQDQLRSSPNHEIQILLQAWRRSESSLNVELKRIDELDEKKILELCQGILGAQIAASTLVQLGTDVEKMLDKTLNRGGVSFD